MPMLDSILAARRETGLTQAQVAARMGTKTPAVARLEAALVSGRPALSDHSAQSCGGAHGGVNLHADRPCSLLFG